MGLRPLKTLGLRASELAGLYMRRRTKRHMSAKQEGTAGWLVSSSPQCVQATCGRGDAACRQGPLLASSSAWSVMALCCYVV